MKSMLASAAESTETICSSWETQVHNVSCLLQKSSILTALQDSELPETLPERVKKNAEARWVFCLSLLTCSGAQQEDKDWLLTKVLNGKVSLFTPNRAVQPLIAVAFSNKQHVCFWNPVCALTLLSHSLLSALFKLFMPNHSASILILLLSAPPFFPS